LIEKRHRDEGLASPYLFPAPSDAMKPIKTVQRHWSRWCDTMGWNGLPLSHVVLWHESRSNPSYSLFFHRYYLDFDRPDAVRAVSKVGKRRRDSAINAMTYMGAPCVTENLIA
jgi:imidazoleglycerol phosphate synthase glutamine amidotransferase subunit HisH